jgi:formylglycine-generating enzyme required for sulfatase activity
VGFKKGISMRFCTLRVFLLLLSSEFLAAPVLAQDHVLTLDQERALKPKDAFKECEVCPEMVVVPAGQFVMGSRENELGRSPNEGPQHHVAINYSFAVGKYEVTVDQFAAFVAESGYVQGSCLRGGGPEQLPGMAFRNPNYPQGGDHPAACLNFADSKAYAEWLARKLGRPYRLLSDGEWEYAARAGSTTRYYFGDDEGDLCRYGNIGDQSSISLLRLNSGTTTTSCNDGYVFTAPVGSFLPNAFGLYDTIGNVWEWIEDCNNPDYVGAPTNGSAWLTGDCSQRHGRGGSFIDGTQNVRSARHIGHDERRTGDNGLRVARSLSGRTVSYRFHIRLTLQCMGTM